MCAAREVLEETGFDVTGLISADEHIESSSDDGSRPTSRLYVVRGVPMNFPFAPRTVGEIGKLQWFKLDDLPTSRRQQAEAGSNVNFFLLFPFVRNLRSYVIAARNSRSVGLEEVGPFEASLNIPGIFGGKWIKDRSKLEKRDGELKAAIGSAMYFEVLPVLCQEPDHLSPDTN